MTTPRDYRVGRPRPVPAAGRTDPPRRRRPALLGLTYAVAAGTGRCSWTSGCRPTAAPRAAGRLDPRRRLHDGRPAVPAGDAAARTRSSTRCSPPARRRDDRLPARPRGAVPRPAARREGGGPLPAGARRRARHLEPSGSASWASPPAATSPRSSGSPRTGPTSRGPTASSGRRAPSTSSSTGTARPTSRPCRG